MWLGGGRGVLSCVGDFILPKFHTLYLTRYRTYTIARPPQTEPWRGGEFRQINTCSKVPLQVNFFWMTTFCIAFCHSNLSTFGPIRILTQNAISQYSKRILEKTILPCTWIQLFWAPLVAQTTASKEFFTIGIAIGDRMFPLQTYFNNFGAFLSI